MESSSRCCDSWMHVVCKNTKCNVFCFVGCLAVYLIIIGDVLVGSPGFEGIVPKFALFLGASEQHSLFTSRWLVVLLVTILFLLPLVSCK